MVHEDECLKAGIDPREVRKIARRISKAALDAKRLGIIVFGGAGGGTLRFDDREPNCGPLILADLEGSFDGGDGGDGRSPDGLKRGES